MTGKANAAIATGVTAHVTPCIVNPFILVGATTTAATPQANARSGTEFTMPADLLHVKLCSSLLSGVNGISPDVRMHRTNGKNIVGVRTNILAKLKQLVTLMLVVAFAVTRQQSAAAALAD